jgi:hypothetical protein
MEGCGADSITCASITCIGVKAVEHVLRELWILLRIDCGSYEHESDGGYSGVDLFHLRLIGLLTD